LGDSYPDLVQDLVFALYNRVATYGHLNCMSSGFCTAQKPSAFGQQVGYHSQLVVVDIGGICLHAMAGLDQ